MNRAYSRITVKAVKEDQRIIIGTATTPTPDRVGDVVEPLGVTFRNPLPLLHQHCSHEPVGTVVFDKPTSAGITFTAKMPMITEPGPLKDRIDTAWGEVKAGLVGAVSIGFREIEYSFMEESHGIRYISCEVLELSLVTIPANAEATITAIKSIDSKALAATGKMPKESDRPVPPGDTGKKSATNKVVSIRSPSGKDKDIMDIAEQIRSFEAARLTKANKMNAIMEEAAGKGETLNAEQSEEYDTLETEIKSLDAHLRRLAALETAKAATAKRVETVVTLNGGSEARSFAQVKAQTALAPGIRFARFAKVKAISRLDSEPALAVAERLYGNDEAIMAVFKSAVAAGSTIAGNWAADLVGLETSVFADFAAYLRPATILGKFGSGGIPALRNVPFRVPLISQTGGGAGYWVGQGLPKPLTAFDFDRTTMEPLKVANIAVLTEESLRDSSPSAEMIVRDSLRDALVARLDIDFLDPAKVAAAGISPASVTNGAATIASTGTDADAVRLDVRAVFAKFITASNPPTAGVWIMSASNALALSIMVNPLGQAEFPGISMNGGSFAGLPVIVSEYAGAIVALVNASDIYLADEGGVTVDMSREASLQMDNAPPTQSALTGTGIAMVSMFQTNSVALRAERVIAWKRRRTTSVAYLTAVAWGGAVPAS